METLKPDRSTLHTSDSKPWIITGTNPGYCRYNEYHFLLHLNKLQFNKTSDEKQVITFYLGIEMWVNKISYVGDFQWY